MAQTVKNPPVKQETQVQSLSQEDPLEKGQPTPVFLPGKFHGQRSLAGYSPWGLKESDMSRAELFYKDLLKCGVGEDSQESLGLQEDQAIQS